MEPVEIRFVLAGDIEQEIDKVSESAKGMSDATQVAYDTMLQKSTQAYSALSKGAQMQADALMKVDAALESNLQVQERVTEMYEQGDISLQQYQQAMSKLTVEQGELNQQRSTLASSVDNEIAQNRLVEGSYDQLQAKLTELQSEYRSLSAEERENEQVGGQLQQQIAALTTETDKIKQSMQQGGGAAGGFASSMKEIPGPIGSTVSGIQKMTIAALKFIATPLGAIIALIVVALKALTTWFKRTEEGQNAMASRSAYFKGILETLLDVVSKVGKYLFEAFSNPRKALTDLVDFIKGQLVNRLKAIVGMGAAIQKIFSKDWKEGLKELAEQAAVFGTGIEDITGKAVAFAEEINKKAGRRAEIQDRLFKLRVEERKINEQIAESEIKIAEARERAYDTTVSEKDRLDAINEASRLIDANYDKREKMMKERLKLMEEENNLNDSTVEDNEKISQMRVELSKLRAERSNEQRALLRQSNMLNTAVNKQEAQHAADLLKEEMSLKKAEYEEYYRLIEATDKEYANRRYADLVADGESYIDYLNQRINALKNTDNRTADEDIQLGMLVAEKEEISGRKKQLDGLLESYKDFTGKMAELDKEYHNEIKALRDELVNENSTYSQADLEAAIQMRTEAYEEVKAQMISENSEFYQVLFNGLEEQSKESVKAAVAQAKAYLNEYKDENGNWLKELNAATIKMLQGIDKKIEEAEKSMSEDSFEKIPGYLQSAAEAASMLDDELSSNLSNLSDMTGSAMNLAAQLSTQNWGAAIATGVGMLLTVYNQIKDSNIEAARQQEKMNEHARQLNNILQQRISYLVAAGLIEPFEAVNSEIDLLNQNLVITQSKLADYFHRTAEGAVSIKEIMDTVYGEEWTPIDLQQALNDLNAVERRYIEITGKTKLRYHDLADLAFISGSRREKFNALLNEIFEAYAEIDKLKESASNIVLGFSRNDITSGIVDGITSGLQLAHGSLGDFADSFGDLLQKSAIQSLTATFESKYLTGLMEKFYAAMEDGELGSDERAALEKEYRSAIEGMQGYYDAWSDLFNDAQEQAKQGLQGAVQGITEETAGMIEGRLNAIQFSVVKINDVLANHLLALQGIERNTSYNRHLADMATDIEHLRNHQGDMLSVMKEIADNTNNSSFSL